MEITEARGRSFLAVGIGALMLAVLGGFKYISTEDASLQRQLDQHEERIKDLREEVSNTEGPPAIDKGVQTRIEELEELAKSAASRSDVEALKARVAEGSTVGPVESEAANSNTLASEWMTGIEKRLTEIERKRVDGPKTSDEERNRVDSLERSMRELQTQSARLDERIKAMEENKIVHPEPPAEPFIATQQKNDFVFDLRSCVLSGEKLTLEMWVTNKHSKDLELRLGKQESKGTFFIGSDGVKYDISSISFQGRNGVIRHGYDAVAQQLLRGVRATATLVFDDVPANLQGVPRILIWAEANDESIKENPWSIEFSSLPLERK